MPKIVDHDQRRREIAGALYRVIARVGLEGASVRAVAAESGWSMGAVRHYFGSQDELLHFGIALQIERITAHIREIVSAERPSRARAQRVLEMLVALDEERLAESRIWIAVLAKSPSDATLDAVRRDALAGERYICRGIVCDLAGEPWPPDDGTPLAPRREREAARLQVTIDGLTILRATYPEQFSPDEVRRLIADELRELQQRLS